jgi:hypothetical protein
MAARDNQGLQIALIIFVLLTISLSVSTYMYFRKMEEAEVSAKAASTKTTDAITKQTAAEQENIELKKVLGAGPRDTVKSILDSHKEDMKAYGGNFKEADQHYRQLAKYLHAELAASDARFVDAKRREDDLKAKIAADEKGKVAEIAQFKANLDKSVADLKTERDSFNESREQFKKELASLQKVVATVRRESEDGTKKSTDEIQNVASQVQKLDKINHDLKEKLVEKEYVADLPRGKITFVNQRGRVVWLNVGSADGVRRQVTFKVLAADETNVVSGKKKGSVEVTRLLDKHLSEARILDDDLSNPIMPNDQIFTPIWVPGRVQHFALVGFMDIDGDHESDRRKIKDLIAVSGGVLDAEVTDDGKLEGEMTINTRYLVMGDRPTDKSASADFLKSYSKIIGEADALGIKKVSLEQFLDNVGYQSEEHTVAMDNRAESRDFKTQPNGGVVRQSNPPFKSRRSTPTATKSSSY